MRYRPNHLDRDLSERLTWDLARALNDAHPTNGPGDVNSQRQFVQLSYIYDLLRSMTELDYLGLAFPAERTCLDALMLRVQELQTELTTAPT